nr:ATP-dependent DNA helicase PIF1-like [Tanacetum cinerariifolium]
MFNKSIFLTSNTNIGQDGKIHGYCGLRLADIPAAGAGVLIVYHNLGPPSHQCSMCNATMWYNERSEKSRKAVTPSFSLCCQDGKVLLPRFNDTPQPLKKLPDYNDPTTSKFKDQIRVTYGNPDLFVAFTSNPKWPEIAKMLAYIPGQKSHDRPKVRTRVFKMKLICLLEDLTKHHIFGKYYAVVYVLEFQKRGLPHAHILMWLEEEFKCRTPDQINDIISVELPCSTNDPDTYKLVSKFMLHGPCGVEAKHSPCTNEGKCLKHYPKKFLAETVINEDGYPLYRRRDNKITAVKGKFTYDNKHVVPHNKPLKLWEENWVKLSEDILDKKRKHYRYPELLSDEQVRNYCLLEIQYLLNTHGGTGKTFLYKTITARLRSERMIVLDVASSGIASLLLPASITAHSRFVIPLELMENSICGIKQGTHLAELLQHVRLIIWDEAPMTQIYAFKALDKMLQDILGYKNQARRNRIFGGMTVLLGGDFRQILPVILNAKRPEIVVETYADFILRQGDDEYLTERAILTPRNDDADAINENMFKKLEGAHVTYNSADKICKASTYTADQHDLYPVEFLNSLNFQGMPPCPLLKKRTPNNAHSEYKPKLVSVQRDETHHH